jgi:hypothetical protein
VAGLLTASPLTAQDKFWDGEAGTTSWAAAANWNPDGVPTALQYVKINGESTVEIPAGFTAYAKRLDVWGDSKLTVAATATLRLDEGTSPGRLNFDSGNTLVTNNGTIVIDNATDYGIRMVANPKLVNNGVLTISNAGNIGGIDMNPGRVENNGTMTINGTSGIADGIYMAGSNPTFHNYGTLTISNTGGDGISTKGVFHNYGTVTIYDMLNNEPLIEGEVGLQFYNYTGGVVKGKGAIHNFAFIDMGGKIAPGIPCGVLQFGEGDEDFNGIIEIDIEGTAGAGVVGGNDKVQVINGKAIFDPAAVIEVKLTNDFMPSVGNQFSILSATDVENQPVFNLPALPAGMDWSTDISSAGIMLSVMAALPVTFMQFKAWQELEKVVLYWQTATEFRNEGFWVEHSEDGEDWADLGFRQGIGTSSEPADYYFEHQAPAEASNYYRLRQTDTDGAMSFSPVVFVDFIKPGSFQVYPKITSGGIVNLHFENKSAQPVSLVCFNSCGRAVFQQNSAELPVALEIGHLPAGLYFLMLQSGKTTLWERFAKP